MSTIADETSIHAISALLNSGMFFLSTGVSMNILPENMQNRLKPTKINSKIHFLISNQFLNLRQMYKFIINPQNKWGLIIKNIFNLNFCLKLMGLFMFLDVFFMC